MRKPFWNKQSQYWMLEHEGKQVRLSKLGEKDPDGATRKDPPPAVVEEWHRICRDGRPEDMQVQDVFTQFMATIEGKDIAKSTNHHLTNFQKFIGPKTKVSKLRPIDLDRWIKKHPGWSKSTMRTFANRVLAALNWAVSKGLIPKNPISSAPGFKRPGRFERRKGVVKPELWKKLCDAATPAFRSFMEGLSESGARPSELRRMRIEKVCLKTGTAQVPNKTEHQTGEDTRTIYFSEGMKRLVAELIGDRTEGFVFRSKTGKPWTNTNLCAQWDRLTNKVPVPKGISLYSLRRSYISSAINDANVNPTILATLVGHVSVDMVLKHYYQADPEALTRALEKITKNGSNVGPDTTVNDP